MKNNWKIVFFLWSILVAVYLIATVLSYKTPTINGYIVFSLVVTIITAICWLIYEEDVPAGGWWMPTIGNYFKMGDIVSCTIYEDGIIYKVKEGSIYIIPFSRI